MRIRGRVAKLLTRNVEIGAAGPRHRVVTSSVLPIDKGCEGPRIGIDYHDSMLLARDSDADDLSAPFAKPLRNLAKTLAPQVDDPAGIPFGTTSGAIELARDISIVQDCATGNDRSLQDVEGQARDFRRSQVNADDHRHRSPPASLPFRVERIVAASIDEVSVSLPVCSVRDRRGAAMKAPQDSPQVPRLIAAS